MKSKSRKGLKCLLAVAAVAVIAVIVYFTSFHNADILKIENGKVKGIKPTWIVGAVTDNGRKTYVKLGDTSAPKDYKADINAEDPDGDPVTTFFLFRGKDPEKNPGTVLVQPYAVLGLVLLVLLGLMLLVRIPAVRQTARETHAPLWPALGRLWGNRVYRDGVVAQFFYVGAQIACWTFIIQYGTRVFMAEGMGEQAAEVLSQRYNIVAMVLFCLMRFVNIWLMKYFKPGRLLAFFAAVATLLLLGGVVLAGGRTGMVCLVAVSGCMSLMFPTIYGMALGEVQEDAELGSAGLIMAILGGSLLPALQAMIIDSNVQWMPSEALSFVVPALCFVAVMTYGLRAADKR